MADENKPAYEVADEFIIHDLDNLKVLADPLRMQIVQVIGSMTPRTVKQVAKALNLSPNKLYYHVNMLEEHGFIQVVETRIVSGIIEKLYLTTANRYAPAPELLTVDSETDFENLTLMIDSVWASTRHDLIESVRDCVVDLSEINTPNATSGLMSAGLLLAPDRAVEFHQKLQALVEEYSADSKQPQMDTQEVRSYRFLYTFFPLVGVDDSE